MSLANLIKTTSGPLKGVWKRRNQESDEEESNLDSSVKKPRYWYVTLESESPASSNDESDSESIYSIQDEETEFVRDSSDTSASAWISTSAHHDMELQVEYDVDSASESDNLLLNISSSDPEDFITIKLTNNLGKSDQELDRFDDTDESLTSLDSEISRADYWTCIQCNTTNNNPLFRYCEKCYQLRKNLFPPRPKRKKRRVETKTTINVASEQSSSHTSELITRVDSGLGSSQSTISELDGDTTSQTTNILSQESVTADIAEDSILCHGNTIIADNQREAETKVIKSINERITDSLNNEESLKTELESNKFINNIELIQKKLRSDEENDNKFCLVCTVSPKDGAFVHGNVSHICCCYRCAVKVWKTTRHCPICQRKVTNVLKAFYV